MVNLEFKAIKKRSICSVFNNDLDIFILQTKYQIQMSMLLHWHYWLGLHR